VYYFHSHEGQHKILSFANQTGVPALSQPLKNFRNIEVNLPALDAQKQIASVLLSIDNKIELNTKINENLEQQAQAIYRSMFVSAHHNTDRIGLLSELITVKYGKDHKKLNDGIIPVYGSGGIMRYVEKFLYDKESVLIPRKGSLNNVMYVDEPFWSVDTMFFTEMKMPNVAKFVFHFLKSKDLASLNAGSAVPSMTTDILNSMQIRIPSAERLAEFETLVAPLYKAIKDNIRQSERLSTLRDTLLPKLMNGEIDVSNVRI
jgi:type I restriction enzyme S subunit